MKKIISLVLSLSILLSIFSGINLTVFATTNLEDDPHFISYRANRYASEFVSKFSDADYSYANTYYTSMASDNFFVSSIKAWEDIHVLVSPTSDIIQGIITKKDMYKLAIFDMFDLNNQTSGVNISNQLVEIAENERWGYMYDITKDVLGFDEDVKLSDLKKIDVTGEKVDSIIASAGRAKSFEYLTAAGVLLDGATNLYEAFTDYSNYQAIANMKKGVNEVLTAIAQDSDAPMDLRLAASECLSYFNDGFNNVLNNIVNGTSEIAGAVCETAFNLVLDVAWTGIYTLIGGPYGMALSIATKGILLLSDSVFNLDKKGQMYYQLQSCVMIENSLRRIMSNMGNTFLIDPDLDNAVTYMRAVEMYKKSILLGLDYSKQLIEAQASDLSTQLFNFITGDYSECISLIKDIENIKNDKLKFFSLLEKVALVDYNSLYRTDYDSALDEINNQQTLKAESVSLSQIKEINIGDNGDIYDYIERTASPENSVIVGLPYFTSENEDILTIDSLGFFEAIGSGECTLTFDKYGSLETSITITVGSEPTVDEPYDYLLDFEYRVYSDTVTITGYCGSSTNVIIPSYINGKKVTQIGAYSFENCTSITSVYIPKGVTNIQWDAFKGCSSLVTINIPNSVDSIGSGAFHGCKSLTNIKLPSTITTINHSAFYNCNSLKNINIPNSVKSIGSGAFSGCKSLEKVYITDLTAWCCIDFDDVTSNPMCYAENLYINGKVIYEIIIPDNVNIINDYTFYNCNSLKLITLHEGITSIGQYSFYNCNSLTDINIPNSIKNIGASAFAECTSLEKVHITDIAAWCDIEFGYTTNYNEGTNEYYSNPLYYADLYINGALSTNIIIPDSVQDINAASFYNCDSLVNIVLPDSITRIGDYAFYNCNILNSVTLHEGITSIGRYSFYNCSSLTNINIPASVKEIYTCAFEECTSLEKVYITDIAAWCSIDFERTYGYIDLWGYEYSSNPLCHTADLYINNITATDITIPESVKEIKAATFYNCNSLTNITLPNNITKIDDYAFYGCGSLKSIIIPNSVTSIGWASFKYCTSLRDINIPNSVTRIYGEAFRNCNLKNITIPNSIERIGSNAFEYSGFERNIYITDVAAWCNITFDNAYANPLNYDTYYSNSLYINGVYATKIVIPDNVICIKDYAFFDCSLNDGAIIIPKSVTNIGKYAFGRCRFGHLLYAGTVEEWNLIEIGTNNDYLNSANIHYNANGSEISYTVTQEPTCTSYGTVLFTCSICNVEKNISLPLNKHNEIFVETVLPTCTTQGYDIYYCDKCNSNYNKNWIDVLGHKSTLIKTLEPTCTEMGYDIFHCSVCNSEYYDNYTDATGHSSSFVESVEPTCTNRGYDIFHCSVCDTEYYDNYIDATGHLNEKVKIVPPTCNQKGYTIYQCSVCEYKYTSDYTYSLGGHNFANGICSTCGVDERWGYYIATWGDGENKGEKFVCIEGFSEDIINLIIPEYIEGYPVQMIDYGAFQNNTKIQTVSFPRTLTHISGSAFYGCTTLKEVHITDLAAWCSVECSDSFSNPLRYADGLYLNGELLTDLVIPKGVESIGSEIFANYNKLTSVTIPSSVKKINSNAFAWCEGLTNVYIKDLAAWCNIEFNSYRANPLAYAEKLYLNGELITDIVIPKGVTKISSYAFSCSHLTSIAMPDSVTSVDDWVFYNCRSLTSVTIGNCVTSIGNYAFSDCSSLKKIILPDSLTSIGDDAFSSCYSLTDVYYSGSAEEWSEIAISDYGNFSLLNATIHFAKVSHEHSWEWITDIEPTCSISGTKHEECTGCKEKRNQDTEIKATGDHNYTPATCTEPETCKVCKKTNGKALGHKSDSGTVTKKATCSSVGTKTYKCTLCKEVIKTENISKLAHDYDSGKVTKKATCKVTGVKTYTCKDCGTTKTETIAKSKTHTYDNACDKSCNVCKATRTVPTHIYTNKCDTKCNVCGAKRNITHTYKTTTNKATLSQNGSIVKKCTVCGKIASNETIKYAESIKLSATSYTYNGKIRKPTMTVKDSAEKTISKSYYTVEYASGRKNVGKYKVTVTFKGKYKGTKTLTFKINPVKTTVKSLTAGKKSLKIAITKETTQVTGYQIQYATNKSFKSAKLKNITSYRTTSVTLKGLLTKKTYYVRVRTYKTVSGVKYYSGWSTVKYKKTK